MTPVLVTGGSGFIGQHLVSELVARGRQVRVLDVCAPSPDLACGGIYRRFGTRHACGGRRGGRRWRDLSPGRAARHVEAGSRRNSTPSISSAPGTFWPPHGAVARAASALLDRVDFLPCLQSGRSSGEEALLSVDEMPGPYTRSKMLGDELALQAAASGMPVIVGCPTMPIGPSDHNVTPPTAMLQYFLRGAFLQIYLDFIVNFVDVRDAAAGLILAMEKGRIGHRYLLGGDSLPLGQILTLMASISGRGKALVRLPGSWRNWRLGSSSLRQII